MKKKKRETFRSPNARLSIHPACCCVQPLAAGCCWLFPNAKRFLPAKTALYCWWGGWNWRSRGGIWKAINRRQRQRGRSLSLSLWSLRMYVHVLLLLPPWRRKRRKKKVCKLQRGPLPRLWSVPSWENSDKQAPASPLMQAQLSQADLCGCHLHTAVLRLYFLRLVSTPPQGFQHPALSHPPSPPRLRIQHCSVPGFLIIGSVFGVEGKEGDSNRSFCFFEFKKKRGGVGGQEGQLGPWTRPRLMLQSN